MPKMYRIMVPKDDRPEIGSGRNMLGVRSKPDANPDVVEMDGQVPVAAGGMSVNMCLCAMPPLMVPQWLADIVPGAKNTGDDGRRVWTIGHGPFVSTPINESLQLRTDPGAKKPGHGFVEPAIPMTLSDYQGALAATQEEWFVDEQRNDECTICGQSRVS